MGNSGEKGSGVPKDFEGRWVSTGSDPRTLLVITEGGWLKYYKREGFSRGNELPMQYDEHSKTLSFKCSCRCCCCGFDFCRSCSVVCDLPVRDAQTGARTIRCNGLTLREELGGDADKKSW